MTKPSLKDILVVVFVLGLSPLLAEAQNSLTDSLRCEFFRDWNLTVDDLKKPESMNRVRGRSSEAMLIQEEGLDPRSKKNYQFILSGRIVRVSGEPIRGRMRAEFKMEVLDMENKPWVQREFAGESAVWKGPSKKLEAKISKGKKVLLWAGSKGPSEDMRAKFPEWVDVTLFKEPNSATIVNRTMAHFSENGTIYYYPEGVLELYLRRKPLSEPYEGKRIFLWSGGCVEGRYPSPWPRG